VGRGRASDELKAAASCLCMGRLAACLSAPLGRTCRRLALVFARATGNFVGGLLELRTLLPGIGNLASILIGARAGPGTPSRSRQACIRSFLRSPGRPSLRRDHWGVSYNGQHSRSACALFQVLVLVAVDVMLKLLDNKFLIINHTFHHVANRHDADYSIVFKHWKMAHGLRSHEGHAFLH
jgi:hypothetical protein